MKKFLLIGVFILFGASYISSSFAQQSPHSSGEAIMSFHSEIAVHINNSVSVTETIVYNSGGIEKHGIYRDITPRSAEGKTMDIKDVSVTDSSGTPYEWQRESNKGDVRLKIGDPNSTFHGEKVYIIHYSATNAVAHLEDNDDIYWNATGNAWPFPILSASATVLLPEGASVVQSACYYGSAQSTTSCDIGTVTTTFVAPGPLGAGEGMTVAVGFPAGIVAPYTPQTFLQKYGITFAASLFPLLLFVFLYLRWKKYGRDPKGTGIIVAQYEVPDGLTPLETGVILNEKFRTKDLSAEIIYLATKGYLKIEQTNKKILGFISNTDYNLTLLKDPVGLPNEFDHKLLLSMFLDTSQGAVVTLSSLKNKFYTSVPHIFASGKKVVLAKQYYKNLPPPSQVSIGGGISALFIIVLLFPGIFIALFSPLSKGVVITIGISLIISIVLYVVFQALMPAKTEKGVATKEYLMGLKEYLQIAEKDHLAFHNAPEKKPEVFEHLLPYAIVLGVEKEWAKEFKDIYITPSSWYQGSSSHAFNALVFTDMLQDFSHVSAYSFARTPHNSGGGSGGGGFSGGGGGGGGGGSW